MLSAGRDATDGDAVSIDFTVGPRLDHQVPSSAIAALLSETGDIGGLYSPGPIVQLDGTISLKLNGRELLGTAYWFELFNLVQLTPLATGDEPVIPERVVTETRTGWIRFERQSGSNLVPFDLRLGSYQLASILPLRPLVNAWTVLTFRIYRLQAHLGDRPSISILDNIDGYFGDGYFDPVDDGLVEELRTAPLEQLLGESRVFR